MTVGLLRLPAAHLAARRTLPTVIPGQFVVTLHEDIPDLNKLLERCVAAFHGFAACACGCDGSRSPGGRPTLHISNHGVQVKYNITIPAAGCFHRFETLRGLRRLRASMADLKDSHSALAKPLLRQGCCALCWRCHSCAQLSLIRYFTPNLQRYNPLGASGRCQPASSECRVRCTIQVPAS